MVSEGVTMHASPIILGHYSQNETVFTLLFIHNVYHMVLRDVATSSFENPEFHEKITFEKV